MNVRLDVKLHCIVTAGLCSGPLTRSTIAALVKDWIDTAGVEAQIDSVAVQGLALDDGTELVEGL